MTSFADAAREHWAKVAVGIGGSVAVWVLSVSWGWLHTNVVFASDLDKLTGKITEAVKEQIAPVIAQQDVLAKQQATNSLAICTTRKAQLRSAIRNTKVEIDDMEKERLRAKPGAWTTRDQQLLDELNSDLEQSQDEYDQLACRNIAAPQ
jgi:hypothetical protein